MTDIAPHTQKVDGRLRRGAQTRARLIAAFIDLMRETGKPPTAAAVAQRAGCSTRSVFERFNDILELATASFDHVIALGLSTPVGDKATADRATRIRFQIEVRSRICENWMAMWRVVIRNHHKSPALVARVAAVRNFTRERLKLMYAPELGSVPDAESRALLLALENLTDFESWARLREDNGLSIEAARELWIVAIDRLLPPTPIQR